jgi:hypothetical protein
MMMQIIDPQYKEFIEFNCYKTSKKVKKTTTTFFIPTEQNNL